MSGARVQPEAQRVHPAVDSIGAALLAWLDQFSLGDERLREARFHVLAARVLPDGARVNVELLAQWTAWLAAQPSTAAHADLASVIEGTVPADEAAPTVLALADLWPRTAVGMSLSWRRRCLQHAHDGSGLIVYDIVESVRRTEIPIGIAHSTAWRTICVTVGELTEWCEQDPPMEEVQHRLDRLSAAQLELVRHLRSCHPAIYAPVLEVAETICAIPGARLAWRQEISP
ncbi:hypothetical protein GCM10022247_49370 [Allokutzneria multivorans]|uniref:Uncharacterized protein n=1 Tax=Allokutzneria multivorans TaxID=1142134 RepID=A0ABP7T1X6_9PSEU